MESEGTKYEDPKRQEYDGLREMVEDGLFENEEEILDAMDYFFVSQKLELEVLKRENSMYRERVDEIQDNLAELNEKYEKEVGELKDKMELYEDRLKSLDSLSDEQIKDGIEKGSCDHNFSVKNAGSKRIKECTSCDKGITEDKR